MGQISGPFPRFLSPFQLQHSPRGSAGVASTFSPPSALRPQLSSY
ncbi:hypothetical protein SLEP1_g54370 [Rubroshorea leprosula]|uniref:Uncharacterized protein n=1 Tax=Rubroshorea leprosula TaxID=152421 RepID=A0AAV5MFU0_9ROSI|nr:hypothetical protein SLEP1_g54370 [Rubroshorea leprosula]